MALRLVFVNHVHPASRSVAGVRLWRFAEELARRGHRVLYITEGLATAEPSEPRDLHRQLAVHDWTAPLLVPCGRARDDDRFRAGVRTGGPRIARRAATALAILFRGGVFWRWRRRAERCFDTVEAEFRPDLVFATFGNLDALNIASALARRCRVPWVLDVKDPLTRFVPRAFWGLVRRRYADAAAITYNAEFQRDANRPLLSGVGTVVYSGADVSRPDDGDDDGRSPDRSESVFTLIGAIYDAENARAFLETFQGFANACRARGVRAPVLRYFGSDHERVREIAASMGHPTCIEVRATIPRLELLAICRTAIANGYLASTRTFHHKLFELLASGRPVIAYPCEWQESVDLARSVGGCLQVCGNPRELTDALGAATCATGTERARSPVAERLAWGRFAVDLERVFTQAVFNAHG